MLATWRWASKQTSKQEQDKEWPALPYLSSKEAEAREDGSEQHFLLSRVRWRKPYLFIFKLVTQQPNISQKDAGTNSRIQAQISQLPSFFQSRGWKVDFYLSPRAQTPRFSNLARERSNDKMPFEVPLKFCQQQGHRKWRKDLSNGLMDFNFLRFKSNPE